MPFQLLHCHSCAGRNLKKIYNKYVYHVYILSNKNNNVLYIGITNDLERRIYEHKEKKIKGFSQKYNCTKLVFFEEYKYINHAIQREKNIKKWKREWKDNLIKENNSNFDDLAEDWDIIKNIDK